MAVSRQLPAQAWAVGLEKPIHHKGFRGTPGGTRTPNLLIRSQTRELGRPGRTRVLGRQSAIHQGLPAIHTKGWPRSTIGLEWHSEIPEVPTKNAFENKVIYNPPLQQEVGRHTTTARRTVGSHNLAVHHYSDLVHPPILPVMGGFCPWLGYARCCLRAVCTCR